METLNVRIILFKNVQHDRDVSKTKALPLIKAAQTVLIDPNFRNYT